MAVGKISSQAEPLKVPPVPHVQAPPPLNPASQVTVTTAPVLPVIEPAVAKLEFATSVAVQAFAVQLPV